MGVVLGADFADCCLVGHWFNYEWRAIAKASKGGYLPHLFASSFLARSSSPKRRRKDFGQVPSWGSSWGRISRIVIWSGILLNYGLVRSLEIIHLVRLIIRNRNIVGMMSLPLLPSLEEILVSTKAQGLVHGPSWLCPQSGQGMGFSAVAKRYAHGLT